MDPNQTIIIKKIKKGGGGHHGGAWKVAYADFVTAMMAFFLLLWLLSSAPKESLHGVAEYFAPTQGLAGQVGAGFEGGTSSNPDGASSESRKSDAIVYGAPTAGAVVSTPSKKSTDSNNQANEDSNFSLAKDNIEKTFKQSDELREFKNNIHVDITPEGLRIQVVDSKDRPMFKPGTTILMPHTKKILEKIAKRIKYMPNYLSIAGHTNEERNNQKITNFDKWTLTAERANSARKFIIGGHVDPDQIYRIEGKADQDPFKINKPDDLSNIRLTIVLLKNSIVPFQKKVITDDALDTQEGETPEIRNRFKRKPNVNVIKGE